MSRMYTAILCYAFWNLFVFTVYGIDKRRSKCGQRRISERALILYAVFMGGLGAWFSMYVFRHKTKHLKFTIGVPLAFGLNLLVIVGIVRLMELGSMY